MMNVMCAATGVTVYMAVKTGGRRWDVRKDIYQKKDIRNKSLQSVPPLKRERTVYVDDLKQSWGRKQLHNEDFKSSSERF